MLQLAMLPLMGRLLGPREFGLYATALPIVTFFTVVADGGLGASLAKERTPDPTVWTTAFYVMLALGICLAGAVNLCGLALAAFMHEPRLYGLMALLSISFLFIAVSTLPAARLVQRNDLVSMSAVDMIATFIGAAGAILFAYKGYGALSLAVQSVATFGVRAIGLNVLAFEIPGRKLSFRALAGHMNTGGVLVGSRLVDMFCRFGENLIFSLAFGAAALGSYTFANQVCRFLCESASNPVWHATYSQSLKLPAHTLSILIRNMSRLMVLAIFPASCLIAASAPEMLPILLGQKWQHAGGFVQVLICSYAVAGTASIGSAVLLATGRNQLFLTTSAFLSVGRVLAVALGPWIGPLNAACAVALIHVAYAGVMALAVERSISTSKSQLLTGLGAPFLAGATGAAACFIALKTLPIANAYTFASIFIGGTAFLATLLVIDKDITLLNVRNSIHRVLFRSD